MLVRTANVIMVAMIKLYLFVDFIRLWFVVVGLFACCWFVRVLIERSGSLEVLLPL